jgi:hypothetical protein
MLLGTEVVPSYKWKKTNRDYPYLYTDSINNYVVYPDTRQK